MSRHRNVRNINLDDEMDDDYDDYDDYEDEEDPDRQYRYDRNSLSANYYTYLTDSGRNSPTPPAPPPPSTVSASNYHPPVSTPTATAPPSTPVSTSIVRNMTAPLLQQNQKTSKNVNSRPSTPQMATPKKVQQVKNLQAEAAAPSMSRPSSEVDLTDFRRNQLQNIAKAPVVPRKAPKPPVDEKDLINLIVVGHVDAGKSTLMGHLLHDLEVIDTRTMDKFKHEAARSGKASFAYAWVLDETEEERERGVTMDIGRTSFETTNRRIVLLDAPGHKDFISNMITGTSQADAAILVVNATTGEFETGFENGGQTKEHALLLRSLGVTQLVVAVNKLDTVDWSFDRYEEIRNTLSVFLTRQAGFSKPKFVPVSGFTGENLVKRIDLSWYDGPSLLELIDSFVASQPPSDGPLRIGISDVLKVSSNQLVVSGKVESGEIEKDDKVYIMPSVTAATVKECANSNNSKLCFAGDYILLTLQGTFEPESIQTGSVIVRSGPDTLLPARKFEVRLVVFEITTPIIKGTKTELYAHSLCVPCSFVKLLYTINKSNGEVLKQRPRFLAKGTSAVVEIETDHDIAIEAFTTCRALGRVTFRSAGNTIGAGIVEKVILPE
uniref:Tr-type G domain-containing protein n=1 Tax=Caenorhabditis tropicalis TaxID=1561998 RepID=A0A1I7UY56_9PELO